jgi:cardiolipin synthase
MSAIRELLPWIIGFAAFGLFAFCSIIAALFFGWGRRPRRVHATATPPVESADFLSAIGGAVNGVAQKGGSAELLENGDAFFASILDAIRAARRSVNFMVYIWEPGTVSDWFVDALAERARAGVQVRVLLDGLGCIRAPKEGIEKMEQAGVQVQRFRPPRWGMLTRFHKRNHRRSIVIDGDIAFTGGGAVGDKWLGDARNEKEWRDVMIRVTGCLAANLQSAFAELWASCCGEILVGEEFYAPDGAHADSRMRHIGVISSPSSEEHPLRLFFTLSFIAAKQRLWITTPYFVPDDAMRKALVDRAREGVDVRLLLPNEHTDAAPIRLAAHAAYDELLEAGVRIYEYEPTFIHTKVIVVDGKWSIVGSANLDIRSKELNEENVLGILDETFAQRLEDMFTRDIGCAREIVLEEWRQRGVLAHFKERLCAAFEEQY